MKNHTKSKERGYVALMATIVISIVLLVLISQEAFSGWYTRFTVLGTEAKEQASALAEGCSDQALTRVITDVTGTWAQSGVDVTMPGGAGTCHIYPVQFNSPPGLVTVKTQAVVRGSYANLSLAQNFQDIHTGTPAAQSSGVIIVQTIVNNNGTSKNPSDFTMHVSGSGPLTQGIACTSTQCNFPGSGSGVVVALAAGAYSTSEDAMPGFSQTMSGQCSGTIAGGDVRTCTITDTPITTTLTVIDNVTNLYGIATNAPGDFPLSINGTGATLGTAYTETPGTYTVSATTLTGYTAGLWGYDCASNGTVTLNAGDHKICIINFADNPPPAPSCADTVMMLDRTGSMGTTDLSEEKTAANSLISLYAAVKSPIPMPFMGVGVFGDGTDNNGLAPASIEAHLAPATSTTLTAATNTWLAASQGYTNLADAITKASVELNGPLHNPSKQKVLVLVSDGDPNRPTGTTAFDTGFSAPAANVQNAAGDVWTNPTNAYTGADAGADASDVLSGANRHRFFNFGFGGGAGLPSGSTVTGIEVQAAAWNTASGGVSATSSALAPNVQGSYDQWMSNTGTDVSATASNDGDTSYIDTSVSLDTFTVANAGVPAGSTINSVTITAVAKSTVAGAPLQLVAEKGGTLSLDPVPKTLTTSYVSYTRTMSTDPTGAAWTLTEVNSWTTHFGVRTTNAAAIPRVTQFYVTVNYSPIGSTGLRPPSSTVAPNSWINASRAFANDALYATDATNLHQQGYANFGFAVPAGSTISGIEATVQAKNVGGFGIGCAIGVELSANGSTYTNTGNSSSISSSEGTDTLGSSNSLWGGAWTPTIINSVAFTLRVQNNRGGLCGGTANLNQVQVGVYYTLPAVTTGALAPVSSGTYDQWTANTGTDVSATAGNDGDTSYIDTSASLDSFKVANAAVPSGAVINSVTITAVARSTVSGAAMQLTVDNGGAPDIGVTNTLTTSYATYTRVMTTNPLTGLPWTLAEVNAWTSRFGVRTVDAAAIPRVTQLSVAVNYSVPPACQLGIDLSWNGGITWTAEKTQTLTGTEATYTLGSAADTWTGSHTWAPTDFSNANFRARVHAINPGASCSASAVDHLDSLQVKAHYTQVADPVAAALNAADAAKVSGTNIFTIYFGSGQPNLLAELASGSHNFNDGHQFGSYNDPGGVTNSNVTAAAQATTTLNQFTNANRAFASDNLYATDQTNGHQQGYGSFSIGIPPGATVNGVEVDVEAKSSDSSGCQIGAALSVNGGSTFPYTASNVNLTSTNDAVYKFNAGGATWGNTWTIDQLSATNFAVRLQNVHGFGCTSNATLSIDQVKTIVYYSVNTENGDGDNFFISPAASDMKGIFQFIGNQVCPAASNPAQTPPPTQGGILVVTQVINNEPLNTGTSTPSDFSMSVSNATNASPATPFSGSATGVVVTVNPGSYSIVGAAKNGYTQSMTPTCSSVNGGVITAGEARVCIVTYDDIPPPPPPPNLNITPGSWQETP